MPLGFDKVERYRGVDFGEAMIEAFRGEHPTADVLVAEGSGYRDDSQYDLVFSNGVIQYFDRKMLASHFANARTMLASGGRFVCASVPWRAKRPGFHSGEFGAGKPRTRFATMLSRFAEWSGRNPMGLWWSRADIVECAAKNGLSCKTYGSMHYAYRFHAVMQAGR